MTEKNVIQTIHDTLWDEMKADERVVVLGEDVGARGGVFRATANFLEEFGEARVIDTPLAESSIVGVAIGMSMNGMIPVAEIQFADFIHPAFDQLVSEAARIRYRSNGDWNVPMVVRTPYGGGVHGALYHSQSIEAFYGHVPGLKVVVPATPYDVKGMLRAAIRDPDPVLFLEHKKTYRLIKGDVPDEPYEVPIGVADVKREGDRLSVIAYGLMLHYCLEAAERLQSEEGISAEVVDVRTIAPLDKKTILDSVRKTGKAMVVYEDNRTYGAGAEIVRDDRGGAAVRPRRAARAHGRPRHPRDAVLEPPRARLHARSSAHLRADEGAREVLAEGEAPEPLGGDLVVLRELTLDDADALLDMRRRNQEFLRPLEPLRPDGFLSPASQRADLEWSLRQRQAGLAYAFGIFEADTGRAVRPHRAVEHRPGRVAELHGRLLRRRGAQRARLRDGGRAPGHPVRARRRRPAPGAGRRHAAQHGVDPRRREERIPLRGPGPQLPADQRRLGGPQHLRAHGRGPR